MMKASSKIIIPFWVDDIKNNQFIDESLWQRKHIYLRYLAEHIQKIYDHSNESVARWYQLNENGYRYYGVPYAADGKNVYKPLRMINRVRENYSYELFDYEFALTNVQLITFVTGCCFLIFEIEYLPDSSLSEITDIASKLAHFFQQENDRWFPYKLCIMDGETEVNLTEIVKGILGAKAFELLSPLKPYKKCRVYSRVLKTAGSYEEDTRLAYLMARGLESKALISENDKKAHLYSPMDRSDWAICSTGAASLNYISEDGQYGFLENGYYRKSLWNDYFSMYMLGLFEQETLFHYNLEAVENYNDHAKLAGMKEELLLFDVCFSYNTISIEEQYQEFYDHLYDSLRLKNLEKEVEEAVQKVGEFASKKKEQSLNGLLLCISLLAVFSALIDGVSFADWLKDKLDLGVSVTLLYFVVFSAIAGICIIGYKKLRRSGDQEENR